MQSATLALAKYLAAHGIPVVADPYVEFHPERPADLQELNFEGSSASFVPIFGFVTVYRFSNRRWLIQWVQLGADRKAPDIRAGEVIALLESVVEENRLATA